MNLSVPHPMAPKNERCQHSWKHQIDSSWFWNKFCANFIHNKKVAWKSSSSTQVWLAKNRIVKSVDFVNSFAPVWWTSTSSSSWMLQALRYINTWYFQSILVSQIANLPQQGFSKHISALKSPAICKFTICFTISVLLEASISLIAAPRAEPTRVATCHLFRHLKIGAVLVLCKIWISTVYLKDLPTIDTPWKTEMEPANHLFEKENNTPNLHSRVPS